MNFDELVTKIIDLRESEIMVLRVPDAWSDTDVRAARELLSQAARERFRGIDVLVLRGGLTLDALSAEDLQRCGLVKVQA